MNSSSLPAYRVRSSSRLLLLIGLLTLLLAVSWQLFGLFQAPVRQVIFSPQPVASVPVIFHSPIIRPSNQPTFSPLPPPVPQSSTSTTQKTATPTPTGTDADGLPHRIQLSVPFSSQAPDGDWSEPWQEGCEEVALLMVDAYLKGDHSDKLPVTATKQKIFDMVQWQKTKFGRHKDIDLAEMSVMAKEYLNYQNIEIKKPATLTDIKKELVAGHPVIVPAAGRELGNPYFTSPGPPYHVFVITGYNGNQFITNENGTRRGYQYPYSSATLQKALRDLVDGKLDSSAPMAYLVLKP